MSETKDFDSVPKVTTFDAVFVLGWSFATLVLAVWLFGSDATSGPVQIALMLNAIVAGFLSWRRGVTWKRLESAMHNGVMSIMGPIIILMLVGALIASWIASGTVPAMIELGLKLISPNLLYITTMILCAVTSIAVGSSWTTASTVGVAMMGVATGLDASLVVTAGAVISGAYFGDKLSPLSDTTNLAAGIAGANLFAHIRGMLLTTVPGAIVAMICFLTLGFGIESSESIAAQEHILTLIAENFDFSLLAWLPPLVLLVLALRRVPAVPTLVCGILVGIGVAIVDNSGAFIRLGAASGEASGSIQDFIRGFFLLLANGYSVASSDEAITSLFNRGGILGMLGVIWLVMAAMMMGSMLETGGYMHKLIKGILAWANNEPKLVGSTLATGVGTNVFAAEQYVAVVLPARMYAGAYKELGLPTTRLSRSLEDSATMTSPLIPWNNCGAFMASTLGVATFAYLPFAILNWLSPLIGIGYAYLHSRYPRRFDNWD